MIGDGLIHFVNGMWLSNHGTARMYSRLNEREIGFELDDRNVLGILLEENERFFQICYFSMNKMNHTIDTFRHPASSKNVTTLLIDSFAVLQKSYRRESRKAKSVYWRSLAGNKQMLF